MTEAVFIICNAVTGEATTLTRTPETAEHWLRYVDPYFKRKGPEWVIAEFPVILGIDLFTFKNFPKSMIWTGVALYGNRKAATQK